MKYLKILLTISCFFAINGIAAQQDKSEILSTIKDKISSLIPGVTLIDSTFIVSLDDKKSMTLKGKANVFDKTNVGISISGSANSISLSSSFAIPAASVKAGGKDIVTFVPDWLNNLMAVKKMSITYTRGNPGITDLNLTLGLKDNQPVSLIGLDIKSPEMSVAFSKMGDNIMNTVTLGSGLSYGGLNLKLVGSMNTNNEWDFAAETGPIAIATLVKVTTVAFGAGMVKMPTELNNLNIKSCSLRINSQKQFSALGELEMGTVECFLDQTSKHVVFAAGMSDQFRFASIDPALALIDSVHIKNAAIVFSNKPAAISVPLNALKALGVESNVIPAGVTVMGGFTTPADLPAGLGGANIVFSGTLPVPLSLPSLRASMSFRNLDLGGNVKFLESYFTVNPADMQFAAGIRLSFKPGDGSKIVFNGSGSIAAPGTFGVVCYMEPGSYWKNPFDIKGMRISGLGLDIGANVLSPVPRPEIGLTGNIQIGPFRGAGAGAINTDIPTKSMISISVANLGIQKIVDSMSSGSVSKSFNELPDYFKSASLNNAMLQVVPQDMVVAGQTFEQGIRVSGNGSIAGLNARMDIGASYTNGISGSAAVAPFNIKSGGKTIFSLSGVKENDSAKMGIALSPEVIKAGNTLLKINGKISMLDASAKTKIAISSSGFYMSSSAKFFNAFNAHFEAKGNTTLSTAAGMTVRAAMKSDLFDILNAEILRIIDSSSKAEQNAYKKAKNDLQESKDYMASIDDDLKAFKKELKKVDDAEDEVSKLKKKYNAIDLDNEPWRAPEKGSLWTSYEAAKLALEGYRKTLEKLRDAIDWSKKEGYEKLADAATAVINGVEAASMGSKKAAKFIVEYGLGGLVDVKSAEFSGALNALSGGKVSMKSNLKYLDEKYSLSYSFSFGSPMAAARSIADSLLKNLASSGYANKFEDEFKDVD